MKVNNVYGKINELEADLNEHDLVIKTLEPLDKQRKCFRLIGGVLVERTVEEVLPAVKQHQQSLQQVGKYSLLGRLQHPATGDRVACKAGCCAAKGGFGV